MSHRLHELRTDVKEQEGQAPAPEPRVISQRGNILCFLGVFFFFLLLCKLILSSFFSGILIVNAVIKSIPYFSKVLLSNAVIKSVLLFLLSFTHKCCDEEYPPVSPKFKRVNALIKSSLLFL